MKKISKLFLILIIIISFLMNLTVFAVESENSNTNNSNTESTNTENSSTENNVVTTSLSDKDSKEVKETSAKPETTTNESNSVKVSYDNSTDSTKLSENVLNILLISVGIVLILLAIAILVKIE